MGGAFHQALCAGGIALNFDNPSFLFFLIIPAASIPLVVVRSLKSREKAALFAASAPSGRRGPLLKELRLRIIMSDIFFLFFLSFLVIALAGPSWGLRIVADYRRGVDLVLAFDLSRSMNVKDCPSGGERINDSSPAGESISRLERGKEIAQELVAALGDVRFGAAVGKGNAVLAVPLTYDSETIAGFLKVLDSQILTGGGTNLELLSNAALGAFQDSIPSRRGIILFSDGEFLSGSLTRAVDKARRAGIMVSAVALGSDSGGPVPLGGGILGDIPDERGNNGRDEVLIGQDGQPVISKRQSELLAAGAEKSGGIYVDGLRDDAAAILAGYVNSISTESRLQGQRREANPRWRFFLLLAIACLGGVRLMGFSRRSRKRGALPVLLCLLLFCSCSKSQGKLLIMEANFHNTRGFYIEAISTYLKALVFDDAAPYAEYGLASAFFALEEGEAALDRYSEAKRVLDLKREDHSELRYRIHYNMGIIYFENEQYDEAVDSFRDALKVDGSRIEAKRNLELSLLSRARSGLPQTASSQEAEGSDGGGTGRGLVLFEYLKEKEQEQWKSREWTGETTYSGPDY